jgi:CoA:oxalate CoA-transferase
VARKRALNYLGEEDWMTSAAATSVQPGPLAGLRVVELAVYAQGPIAGSLLGMLGAEVIKLEPASGDPTRQTLTASSERNPVGPPNGFLWMACNANKQSAIVDMRVEGDRARFRELIASADAFISNLLELSLAGYGADEQSVKAINPNIVYGRTGGLGFQGPLANDPCQDTVGMAYAGMMDVCALVPGEPNYPQYALSDVLSGTMLAFGVVTSLLSRERLGIAPAISTSQLQTLMWAQVVNLSSFSTFGTTYPRHDRIRPRNPLFNMYEASDGKWLAMGCIRPEHWDLAMPMLGLEHLLTDPRYSTMPARAENSRELTAMIASAMKQRPRDEWLAMMRAAKLYVAKLNRMEDLVDDEQVAANGLLIELEDGFKTVPGPFNLAGYQVPRQPPPSLGSWDALAATP